MSTASSRGRDLLSLTPVRIWQALLLGLALAIASATEVSATTYYVSSATGSDSDDGLTPGSAFASIGHINALELEPGDQVLFLCGESWRAQPLVITASGTAGAPIVFSSHPADCAAKPVLSGAQPISGWALFGANIYRSDLDTGLNAGLFPLGLNQLFRGANRLPMGRWPNISGHPDGGYAEVDSQPSPTQIVDSELPPGDWSGAVMHIKGIRWYMLNREVASSSGTTLNLEQAVQCWGGDCAQWGYFLNSHLATLDQEGEWYFDAASKQVYLYTLAGAPADGEIEGSALTTTEGVLWGGVVLGKNLAEHISWVTIENLRIERWFDAGITTPINLEADENHDLVIRNNDIVDVDTTGIRLTTWVWDAAAHGSGPNGWRGGRNHLVEGNTIDGANHFGIDSYGVESQLLSNVIRNVALIENLGRSGMGCGYAGTNCTENGAGIRLKHDPGAPDHTSRDNLLRFNRLSKVGMNGIDVFGRRMTLENNVIDRACFSKGDCGAIRTFGRNSLATTPAHDITIKGNVIKEVPGNTDGTHPNFETLFGFGIYIDNYSRDVTVQGNTVTGATWEGVLFQHSTGVLTGNTLYDNVASNWGSEVALLLSGTEVTQTGNTLFPLAANRRTLRISNPTTLTFSEGNRFFSPYDDGSIVDDTAGGVGMTLAEWQSWSGHDGTSAAHWYTRQSGEPPLSKIFINDTAEEVIVDLAGMFYLYLNQQPVGPTLTLPAFSSQILIEDPGPIFIDGFESGDTSRWSSSRP
ncbi:MAG: right-handed parallel beta-helix repeat-containing protein [Acidobacteria bacterium]|nr:MAG: right-handed parallel beta-helix repeat-containing protein [Acidobacteriota bacterium]